VIHSVMKRGASALVLVGLIGPMVFAADATPPYSPEISKLHGDLAEVLRLAAPDELVPVKAIMTEQVPRERIQEIIDTIKVRDLRYRITKDLLKPLAEQAQVDLLAMLRTEQATGSVGPRIRTLWISNIVAADVTPDVAYRMAARDDVALLAHNPKVRVFPEPGEIQDEPIQEPASGQEIECGVEVMGAPRVWDELGFTGRGAVVAMIDTGACPTHPDIVNQIWSNPGEIAGNGIDDDDNGFIDDTWGWNFDANNNNPTDSNSHGSHTAGTVGGDGTGGTATGVAPDVSLMILKVGVSFSDEVDVWSAMQYAADNRAHTFSMSLGWPHSRNPVRRTWREISINGIAMGTAGVVAAGNDQAARLLGQMEGNLTGCVYSHSGGKDDANYDLVAGPLRQRVGRLLNDKMPTGVAVSSAMNHGGPYPSTGHPGFTAVGMPASLIRFAMLQSYDNVRPARLPLLLRDKNLTDATWRLVDGQWTTADVDS